MAFTQMLPGSASSRVTWLCPPAAVSAPRAQVTAEPSSINELSEYSADPRTPDKLVDGVYMTCDDLH
eukprot:scaffold313569_cov40-Prasinocladus_malaysianus.AAC.1